MHGRISRILSILLYLLLLAAALPAEELYSDLGFFIDLPAGWTKSGQNGTTEFEFSDPSGSAYLSLTAFPKGKFISAEAAWANLKGSVKAEGNPVSFSYSGRSSALVDLSFKDQYAAYRGYAVLIIGSPRQYELVAYTTEDKYEAYHDFLVSALDGFSIDEAARRLPGPVSQFDTPFPGKNLRKGTIDFLGKRLEISMDNDGEDASQALVEREYRVLKVYTKAPQFIREADERFYRMIYRDSYARLAEVSLLIARELDRRAIEALASTSYQAEKEKALAAGIAVGNEDTQKARDLLSWVQGFGYERNLKGSDVVNPLGALLHAKADCDGRALLMTILLHRLNIDAILMVSPSYSHAMVACGVPGGGRTYRFKDKEWLFGETTAKAGSGVGLGMIAQNMSDMSKWYGVDFGF